MEGFLFPIFAVRWLRDWEKGRKNAQKTTNSNRTSTQKKFTSTITKKFKGRTSRVCCSSGTNILVRKLETSVSGKCEVWETDSKKDPSRISLSLPESANIQTWTMSGMKCRGCGEAGHLTFKCPNRGPKKDEANPHQPSDEPVAPNSNKQKPRRFEKPDEPTPPNSNKHNSRRIAHDQEVRNSNKHKPRRVNGQENNNVSKTPKTPASTLRSKEGPNGSLKASHRTLEQTLGFSPKDLLKQQEQFQDVIKTPSSRLSSLALNVAKNLSFNQQEQRSDNFWNKLTEACNKHLQENPCEVEAVAQLCGFSLGTSRTQS
eukprot:g62865.t1